MYALGHRSVAMVAGHDAGAGIAAYCALVRPDIFRSVTIMSTPFTGAPTLPFDTANGSPPPPRPLTDDELDRELAKLTPPRKYYQNYFRTREATRDLHRPPQGLRDFLRAYFFFKSGDYEGNEPHPLGARTAAELGQLPTYYVMEKAKSMAETVAQFMPSREYIQKCDWLTDAELGVYVDEYSRTGFTGGLQLYRVRVRGSDPVTDAELAMFADRSIDVPSLYIGGQRDWGVYQTPGATDTMKQRACTKMVGFHLVEGAGHWIGQERPEAVTQLLLNFAREHGS